MGNAKGNNCLGLPPQGRLLRRLTRRPGHLSPSALSATAGRFAHHRQTALEQQGGQEGPAALQPPHGVPQGRSDGRRKKKRARVGSLARRMSTDRESGEVILHTAGRRASRRRAATHCERPSCPLTALASCDLLNGHSWTRTPCRTLTAIRGRIRGTCVMRSTMLGIAAVMVAGLARNGGRPSGRSIHCRSNLSARGPHIRARVSDHSTCRCGGSARG